MADYRNEANLRDLAALTPEERARSAKFEASDPNLRELRAEIDKQTDPQKRAILQNEYSRLTGGEYTPETAPQPPGRRRSLADADSPRYVPADDLATRVEARAAPADRTLKRSKAYLDLIAGAQEPPAEAPPPSTLERVGQFARRTLGDAADAVTSWATKDRPAPAPGQVGAVGAAGDQRSLPGMEPEAAPMPPNTYQASGPGGVLRDIRDNDAARAQRLAPPPASVLQKPDGSGVQVPEQTGGFTPQEMAEGSIAPWKIEEQRRMGEYVAPRNPQEARPFDTAQNIAQNVREFTDNPVARGAVAGFSQLGQTGIGAVRLAADLVGAEDVAGFSRGASRIADTVGQGATSDLNGNEKLVADVTSSIMNSAPAVAIGAIGGRGLTTLFAQSTLAEYNAGRDAGFDVGASLGRAGIMGTAEALGERFGFSEQLKLIKAVTKGLPQGELAKVMGAMLMKEIPGEQLTTAMQFMADKIGPAALNQNATIEDYLNAAGETLKVTVAQTAVMGGGPAAIVTARNQAAAADRAIERSAMTQAERAAQDAGFLRPVERRKQLDTTLDDLAAEYGISPKAVKAIREQASRKPLDQLAGFYKRAVQSLAKLGLTGKPVDEAGLGVLDQVGASAAQGDSNATTGLAGQTAAGAGDQRAGGSPAVGSDFAPGSGGAQPAAGFDRPQAQDNTARGNRPSEAQPLATPAGRASDLNTGPIPAEEVLGSPLDEGAHQAATSPLNDLPEPTTAQKQAGNYKVGRVKIDGLDVSIENPKGSIRRSADDAEKPWQVEMPGHYGYIRRTQGADGDHVDLFIGDRQDNGRYWIVNQNHPDGGFDEHKVITGVDSAEEAVDLYKRSFADGFGDKVFGSVSAEFNADQLKQRLPSLRKAKPVQRPATKINAGAPTPQPASGDAVADGPAAVAPAPTIPAAGDGGRSAGEMPAGIPPQATASPAPSARVIARAGRAPNSAEPIELRSNPDGTATPYMGGKAMLDYESGSPITLPGDVSDLDAKKAIREAGAVSDRTRFFPAGAQADQAAADLEAGLKELGGVMGKGAEKPSTADAMKAIDAVNEEWRQLQRDGVAYFRGDPVTSISDSAPQELKDRYAAYKQRREAARQLYIAATGKSPDGKPISQRGEAVAQPADASQQSGQPVQPNPRSNKVDQRAARAKARMAFDPQNDTVLQALAKMGGIRRDVVASEFGLKPEELKHTVKVGGLNGFPFRKTGGMDLDRAMTALREAGYFTGVADEDVRAAFEQAIYDELGGGRNLTVQGQMADAQRQAEERALEEEAAARAEYDAEAQAEREAIMAEAGVSEEGMATLTDDDIDLDAKGNASTEAFMRAMGASEQEIADAIAEEEAGRRAAQRNRQEAGQAAGEEARPADGAGSGQARAGAAEGLGHRAVAPNWRSKAGNGNAGQPESAPNRGPADIQRLAALGKSQSFSDKGLRGLDAETRRAMLSDVVRVLHDPQILQRVVQLVPVDVVHDIAGKKGPAERLLNDEAVLKNLSAVDSQDAIPVSIDAADTVVRAVASVAAEQSAASRGRGNSLLGVNAAMGALKSNAAPGVGAAAGLGAKDGAAGSSELERGAADGSPASDARNDGHGREDTLSAYGVPDLKAKTEREEAAARAEKAQRDAEQARLKKEADDRDARARADATVDDFQLGQSAEQQMSGMGDLFAEGPAQEREAIAESERRDAVEYRVGDVVQIFYPEGDANHPDGYVKFGKVVAIDGDRFTVKPNGGKELVIGRDRLRGNSTLFDEEIAARTVAKKRPTERKKPAETAAPAPAAPKKARTVQAEAGDSDAIRQAKADALKALGDLGDILSKPGRATMLPEQEQKLLPVLTRLFDAAFRLGYLQFKEAVKFVLDQIRTALGTDVADAITLDHLQGAYIGMSGKYRDQGASTKKDVVAVESLDEIEAAADNEDTDVPDTDPNLERDRGNAEAAPRPVESAVPDEVGAAAPGAVATGEPAFDAGGRLPSGEGLPAGGAAAAGERGDQPVRGDGGGQSSIFDARADDDPRGGGLGDGRIQPDAVAAEEADRAADRGAELIAKRKAQREAQSVPVKPGDIDNIRQSLPFLLPGQQEDVLKAERRFAEPDGYGMLFTNGTGTGKTFTGLGVVKRFERQGKKNILIVVPSDKIAEDWINSGKELQLDISQLADTRTAGRGIVITTYANLGMNDALASREWDLVVPDEAHYLMQEKEGTLTQSLASLRAITRHPAGAATRARMLHRELHDKAVAASEASKAARTSDNQAAWDMIAKLEEAESNAWRAYEAKADEVKADVLAKQGAARTRVTFLSATPFAYDKTIDWANGYLFDYGEGREGQNLPSGSGFNHGYNSGDWREQFFMQHLGYRMRYNKLTEPDAKVDRGLLQRQFNGWLKKRGVLSGRMLDVAADYDRRFALVDSAIGRRIDEALEWLRDHKQPGRRKLAEVIDKRFDYLSRRYLLEAIKAEEAVPLVKQHLAMGRKVVVFHDYKKGGGFHPFEFTVREDDESLEYVTGEDGRLESQSFALAPVYEEFKSQFKDLMESPFASMRSPIEVFQREFPGVLIFNGDVPPSQRRAAVAKFQDDATGPQVFLAQTDAAKVGISLHDTTGKHQRVLINLGQPTQPTTAIQQEGRIYRTGQVTDAIIRYLNTGTSWEKWAFASTIATRASTAENLGMGEMARALKDSFIAAFEESDSYPAGHENEGKGGKERDRLANEAISEYDRAKAFYWGTQKKSQRNKAEEGTDYFATPEPVGLKMVEWLDLRAGEAALEPSGGHGAIARWFGETTKRTAVEPSSRLAARLALVFDGEIRQQRFEDLHVVNKFDGIAMNPPFGTAGRTAIDHLAKAATHLRPGGRIAALLPTGQSADAKFDKWFYEEASRPLKPVDSVDLGMGPEEIYVGDSIKTGVAWQSGVVKGKTENGYLRVKTSSPGETLVLPKNVTAVARTGPRTETYKPAEGLYLVADIKLPGVTFERAATNVMTRIVVLEKSENAPQQINRDYTDAKDINELFDRLETLTLPPRSKPAEPETPAVPDTAAGVREQRRAEKEQKAQAQAQGAELASQAGAEVVEHVTQKGKTIKGVIRTDLTKDQAQSIDPYTWKKGGGYFIRLEHLAKLNEKFPPGGDIKLAIAYHGTPYRDIKQFDTANIGTGEGAQAYGWGLYFASKKEVAEHYRKTLAGATFDYADNATRDRMKRLTNFDDWLWKYLSDTAENANYDPARMVETLNRYAERYSGSRAQVREIAGLIETGKLIPKRGGALYQVEVPDDNELLLWDQPLSKQPPMVRAAIESTFSDSERRRIAAWKMPAWALKDGDDPNIKYEDAVTAGPIYNGLASDLGSYREASETLLARGVKGIKYLDGGSRSAGQGSYNYVIFDGADAQIRDVMLSTVDGSASGADTGANEPASPADRAAVAKLQAGLRQRFNPALVLDAVAPPVVGADGQPLRGANRHRAALVPIFKRLFDADVTFFRSNIPFANGVMQPEQPGRIFVNITSERPWLAVTGHELLHKMRQDRPDLYSQLHARIMALTTAKDMGMYGDLMGLRYEKVGYPMPSQDGIQEEFIADVVGDNMMDPKFWRALMQDQPSGFRRVIDAVLNWLDDLIQRLTDLRPFNTGAYLTDIRAAREAVVDALRNYSAGEVGTVADQGEIRLSVATGQAGGTPTPSTGVLDTILRRAGGTLLARLTSPGYDKLLTLLDNAGRAIGGEPYLYAKAGLVADYGLGDDYKAARADMQTGIRKGTREAATVIEQLQTLDRAQARIAYLWMQEKPDTELERELLAALPDESREHLLALKRRVDELGREAVRLGLLSPETYERNAMAYLHRSYKKYELNDRGEPTARSRAIRIHGEQFKGRGMRDDVTSSKIGSPDWWQRKQRDGSADTSLKGQKFHRLELRALPDEATPDMIGGREGRLGKLQQVLYWPADEAIPPQYADWRNDGLWEARFFDKAGKVGMWRDFTLVERTKMGEIQEVRYSAAKTLLQATRDIETAKLLDWIARNKSVMSADMIPEGATTAEAKESLTRSYLDTEWVKVPLTEIVGTAGLRRYGNLAGRYVPGPVWNDIRQITALTEQGDLASAYQRLLTMWKISKTALSPATHTNNVMSNFILADSHDIQARHMLEAARAWLRHKDRGSLKADPAAKKLIEDYQDHGGDGGKFNEGELREDVAKELLDQLERDVNEQPEATAKLSAAQVFDLLRHREFRQAFAAIGQTKTAGYAAAPARQLIKLYGREDELFRLAAFIKARADGLSDHDAGRFARESFLDYSINAPWINALRRTAFPFIAFTYRAVPMLLRTFADKPWKLAKYALVAGGLNALAYAISGGDEEKERALLPDEKAGKLWGIFPKLIRMPWDDENGSPVFLDIRRWVPAGDVIDTGANHAAVPVPAPLMPGGPLVILAEVMLNKQGFTGREITKETDSLAERWGKFGDYMWKSAMPNFPGLPGTYSTTALMNAGGGKTDVFGREQNLGQAAASALGVKLASYPADVLTRNAGIEARSRIFEIRRDLRASARELARNGITQAEYEERVRVATEKIQAITAELNSKVRQSRGELEPAAP